jgi:hypothetical protein
MNCNYNCYVIILFYVDRLVPINNNNKNFFCTRDPMTLYMWFLHAGIPMIVNMWFFPRKNPYQFLACRLFLAEIHIILNMWFFARRNPYDS